MSPATALSVSSAPRREVPPSRGGGAAFLSPSARTERCRHLAEAGHLLARVVAVGDAHGAIGERNSALELAPGSLGPAIYAAVEISLALRGALPPAVGLDADVERAAHDQLFRVRTLGSAGLVVVFPTLVALAPGGALGVDDSTSLRAWHELARREPVTLLFDAEDRGLSMLAPQPLVTVLDDVLLPEPVPESGTQGCADEDWTETPAPVTATVGAQVGVEAPVLGDREPTTLPFDQRSTAEHLTFAVRGPEQPATLAWEDAAPLLPYADEEAEDVVVDDARVSLPTPTPSSPGVHAPTAVEAAVPPAAGTDLEAVPAAPPSVELGATLRAALDALPAITEASSPGLLADDLLDEDDDDWTSSDAVIEAELGPPPSAPTAAAPEPEAPEPSAANAIPIPGAGVPEAQETRVIPRDPLDGMDEEIDEEPYAPHPMAQNPAPWLSLDDRERYVRELTAATGPRPVKAIEEMFRTRWMPLFEALCQGLDDPEVARAVDDWSAAFEHSYHEGFNTMRLTGKRPTMVLDAPDVAARVGRLNGARAVQLLLVDGMRYDLGLRVREALADQLRGQAACVDENLLWSALPTVTPVQMRLLSTGPRGLREGPPPSDRDPIIHREGSVTTLRRVRIGQRDVIKLDLVEARLRDSGPGFEARMSALAEEVAEVIASFVDSLPPRTLLYLFGDHGFHLPLRGPRATGPAEQGGASPEEVLVGGQAWLVDDTH